MTVLELGNDVLITCKAFNTLVSSIFEELRTFVIVPDVLSKFSKTGNIFLFR